MNLNDFAKMVEGMTSEIPAQYLDGIAGIDVSPRVVRHPTRGDIYTMGECVPIDVGGEGTSSRVILYHGSFRALSQESPEFDWRAEAWETITHELRHHLEWKAGSQDLEEYDRAAEEGFARVDQESFDPLFFLSGERIAPGVYRVDDDVFIDRQVPRAPATLEIAWEHRRYRVPVSRGPLPLYLILEGIPGERSGELIVVVRRRPRILDLFRRRQRVTERRVVVECIAEDS
jgi:hypothetical protein